MVTQVHDTTCRSCGAAADIGQTKCRFCKQPVLISIFNSVYSMPMPMVSQYAAAYRELNNYVEFWVFHARKLCS